MTVDLLREGAASVAYHLGRNIEPTLSPRPYLLATTASGTAVTESMPDDHVHHLGVSAAIPDVDGISFWGGRTYVRERGSVLLDNHGVQTVESSEHGEGRLVSTIAWLDPHGALLLSERRIITARADDHRVEIGWVSELTASERAVSFGSPETNGRDGAFYGGIFWRTPFPDARVSSADGGGADVAHGSLSPWLALSAADASLVAVTTTGMPWFVRNSGYTGFGPAVAAGGRRELAQGETLRLDLAVAILDAPVDDAAGLAADLLQDTLMAGNSR